MKDEFERIRAIIGELADVLDLEFPQYVIEVDKALNYKQMIINKDEAQENKRESEPIQKSKYHPFESELTLKFYRNLPDFTEHVIQEEEAQELIKRERIESDDLMAIELKKI